MQVTREDYVICDDRTRLDLDRVCKLLNATYWAAGRSREVIEKSIEHSVCLGMYHRGALIGFARAVTDHCTFTYFCDVVVDEAHRSRGLGKWLVEVLLGHPEVQTITQTLRTKDAHTLYERFGFERTEYLRKSQADWEKKTQDTLN